MNEPPIVRAPPPDCPARPAGSTSRWRVLLDNRRALLSMLFLVTGFLGIPILWLSPKFSHQEKVVWSLLVTLYTLLLIGGAVAILWWSFQQIAQVLSM
ncbi:MAG: hypothetical protein KDA45_00080 [Planctomycetales bacterium]|nr:hypothetical protein [Planctomycetales bacterium]